MVIINKVQAMLYECCLKAVANVYDEVPEDKVFPCVVIGDINVKAMESKEDLFSYTFDLNVFSMFNGKKEANKIIEDIIVHLGECVELELQDNHYVDDVQLIDAKIFKIEGLYQGKALISIDIFEI